MIGAVFRAPEARFRRRETATAARPISNTAGQSHTTVWEERRAGRPTAAEASEPSARPGSAKAGLEAGLGTGSLAVG
jgi:hypothetical protein